MEDLSGSFANHLIPKRTAAVLALVVGFGALGPANAGAEAPDVIAGESFGFDCGAACPHSGATLPAGESFEFACGVACPHTGDRLLGSWHVLVHYEDVASSGSERARWDDRAWVFEREGDRLRWTDYPIVVFDDQTGRFENGGANRASRILHHWQPNQAQLADIEDGLAVNDRGMASAALRLSDERWVSAPKQAVSSASMIRYEEGWFVDRAAEGPIFKREDALRSERAGDLMGVTIYTTRETADGGRLLRGDYERDGAQRGTFTMTRAAGVHGHGN
jgi:hypothetical protein